MDTDFYYRMFIKNGNPIILQGSGPISVVTTWSGQTTNTSINDALIDKEMKYIKCKYTQKI